MAVRSRAAPPPAAGSGTDALDMDGDSRRIGANLLSDGTPLEWNWLWIHADMCILDDLGVDGGVAAHDLLDFLRLAAGHLQAQRFDLGRDVRQPQDAVDLVGHLLHDRRG